MRVFDRILAALALGLLSPLLLVAAVGVRLSSPGPVFYRATRVGRGGAPFRMYKFRTMQMASGPVSPITATHDARVFAFGRLLRQLKIDELPQLWNILRGEMAIIGPRPEDPLIVQQDYHGLALETLRVLPGLSSPGTLYATILGDDILDTDRPAEAYRDRLLSMKLALDVVYVRRASVAYDLRLIGRTLWVVICRTLGRRRFPRPPEMMEALGLSQLIAPPAAS